jgi:hypothetical protein
MPKSERGGPAADTGRGCPKIESNKIMDLCGVIYLTASDNEKPAE